MKKILTLILVLVYFFTCFPGLAIGRDDLIGLLVTADTEKSSKHALEIAIANVSVVEEILLVPAGHPVARHCALSLLVKAVQENRITMSRFLDIMLHQVKNISTFSKADWAADDLVSISNIVSYISYTPQSDTGVSVKENFGNLLLILDSMQKESFIKNQGIRNSLEKKFENSARQFEGGKKRPAINILNAAINEINAQSGKHIDELGAEILIGYIKNLIAQIENQ